MHLRRKPVTLQLLRRSFTVKAASAVECVDGWPSTPDFARHYFDKAPLVVKGGAEHWRARQTWTTEYLRQRCGHQSVPVEVGGSNYLDPLMERVEMPFALFLDYLDTLGEDDAPPPSHSAYMAQARLPGLLDHFPAPSQTSDSLSERRPSSSEGDDDGSDDIEIPEVCSTLGHGDVYALMAWLGPKGTTTPLHRDPYHNILAQVHGSKRLLLYSPRDEPKLYPSTDPLQTNSSQVDAESPNLALFPRFSEAQSWTADLGPGDVIYIPRRWWHHVKSLSKSTSVSIWWL